MKRDPVRASVLATKIIPNVAADLAKELGPVSYTHLDVYKRQPSICAAAPVV